MRRRLLAGMLLGGMLLFLWQSRLTAEAVRQGLTLCARSVIPALFPYFVLSGLFVSLGFGEAVGRRMAPLTEKLFGVGGAGAAAFLLGLMGGYPVGGRTVGQLYRKGALARGEAERLLAFCNNAGPSFSIGIAGLGCFGSLRAGLWLCVIHAAAAMCVGVLLKKQHTPYGTLSATAQTPPLSGFIRAVQDAAGAMVQVCAFVVFARVIQTLFAALTGIGHPAVLGFLELTGGITQLGSSRSDFIWAAALLGWGGLSVHGQTAAVLADTDLRMGKYFAGKMLQAALSAALAVFVSAWAL